MNTQVIYTNYTLKTKTIKKDNLFKKNLTYFWLMIISNNEQKHKTRS